MNSDIIYVSISLLLLLAGIGIFYCYRYKRSSGSYFNARLLVLLNFIAVEPLSGIAHLTGFSTSRGFYDILAAGGGYILKADAVVLVSLLCLLAGLGSPTAVKPIAHTGPDIRWGRKYDTHIAALMAIVVGAVAFYGLIRVNNITSEMRFVRGMSLDGGTARYAFLSQWISWAITFAAVLLVDRFRIRNSMVVMSVLGGGIAVIAISQLWSSGRSVILLLSLPLILYLTPALRRLRILALTLGVACGLVYISNLTIARLTQMGSHSGVDFVAWLDWEWGRYSMMGVAFTYVDEYGFLNGLTLINAFGRALEPFLGIVELSIPGLDQLTSPSIASFVIYGVPDHTYIVPGLSAELYMNYGFIAVALGYYFIGRMTRWVDAQLSRPQGALQILLLYYLCTLLILRSVSAEFFSSLVYLFYTGGPLFLAAGLSAMSPYRNRPVTVLT